MISYSKRVAFKKAVAPGEEGVGEKHGKHRRSKQIGRGERTNEDE